jgi:hypothetical protein
LNVRRGVVVVPGSDVENGELRVHKRHCGKRSPGSRGEKLVIGLRSTKILRPNRREGRNADAFGEAVGLRSVEELPCVRSRRSWDPAEAEKFPDQMIGCVGDRPRTSNAQKRPARHFLAPRDD